MQRILQAPLHRLYLLERVLLPPHSLLGPDKALAELSQTHEEATKVAAELAQARGESKKAT